MSEMVNNMD